jgi:hypothetical protein
MTDTSSENLGGDIVRRGYAGSPGSDGASPYLSFALPAPRQRRRGFKPVISARRLAGGKHIPLDLSRCWQRLERRHRTGRGRHRGCRWRLDGWRRRSRRCRLRIARRKRSTGNLSKRGHRFSSRLSLVPDVSAGPLGVFLGCDRPSQASACAYRAWRATLPSAPPMKSRARPRLTTAKESLPRRVRR